jgi:hypothetical protein
MFIILETKENRYLLHMTEEKRDLLGHLNKEYRKNHSRFWLQDILTGESEPVPLEPLYQLVFGDRLEIVEESLDYKMYKLD